MSNMEFCYPNYLQTTTNVSITSGSTTVANLFDRKSSTYYTSVGLNNDTTACTIRIEFSGTKNVNRLVLENINWKSFVIYYQSNTANKLALLNAPTTTSEWSTNSTTSMLLKFATVSASIFTLAATTTMVANKEKEIGGLWFLEQVYSFTDNPEAKEYDPNIEQKQYKHEMSDGGASVYFIQDNFKANIKRKFVSDTERKSLWSLYTYHSPLVFIPFPTGTSWDGGIWEVNWTDKFDFNQYYQNVKDNGFTGQIKLEETPK